MPKRKPRPRLTDEQQAFAVENLGLVGFVVRKMTVPWWIEGVAEQADLWQWGYEGLLEAILRYEPARGAFSTWAILCIRRLIIDNFRSLDPLSKEKRSLAFRLTRVRAQVSGTGIHDAESEVARALGLTVEQLRALDAQAQMRCVSIDEDRGSLGGVEVTFADFLVDENAECPQQAAEEADTRRRLRDAIARLPKRERYVMRRILDGVSLPVIARELGISDSRASQHKQRAIAMLRESIGGQRGRGRAAAYEARAGRAAERCATHRGSAGSIRAVLPKAQNREF